jgi:hypothetical protein
MHTGGTEREHLSGRDWSLQNVSLSYIILLNMDQKKLREKKKEEEEWSWQRNTDTPIDRGVSSLFPPCTFETMITVFLCVCLPHISLSFLFNSVFFRNFGW